MPATATRPLFHSTSWREIASGIRPRLACRASLLGLLLLAGCGGCRGGVSTAGPTAEVPGGLPNGALLAEIDRDYSPAQTLGYARARDVLYLHEQDTRGALCGLYTDFCVTLPPGDPSAVAAALGVNAEHVWPQSMGADEEPLKSDLHHLFPARDRVNTSRSNLPFGEIPDDLAEAWYWRDASQSRPPRFDADGWSERGAGRFEPPESRKGDVARAVFYVAAVYPERANPTFFQLMRADLLAWNRADPPDDAERARSAWVATLQGTENPFVGAPSLADRIWGGGSARAPSAPPTASSSLRITELHYDNVGDDVGEGVEVAGPPGTSLDGWRIVLVNGNGGAVYDTIPLSGSISASGAVWTGVKGIQNGSPDGLALVAPDGTVVEFLSYEGTLVASDGPARGTWSVDLGASQATDTPVGTTLHRRDGRWVRGPASPGRTD
ncbi:endonuclease [Rubrivirga sp.]|uniref:endonuclease n=1 Tax=Rubrivirga sp. TaxID=1885344 RepID=UPI003B520324